MDCLECGVVQPPHARFCGHCGARLVDAPPAGRPRPQGYGRGWKTAAVLVVVGAVGMTVAVVGSASMPGVGRDEPSGVVLPTGPVAPTAEAASTLPGALPVLRSLPTGPGTCTSESATSIACPRWKVETRQAVLGRPTVAGRQVLIGVGTSIAALRTETGELLWQRGLGHPLGAAPTVDGGMVVVADDGGVVTALDRGTGVILWRQPSGGGRARVAVAGGVVVVAHPSHTVTGLARDDGTPVWSVPVSGQPSRPVTDGKTVYVGDGNGQIRAISLADGDVRWSVGADGWEVALANQNRVLAVSGFGGPLVGLDPDTGDQLWASDIDVGWATPHPLPDGTLVVQAQGQLQVIDTTDGTSRPLVNAALEQNMLVGPDGLIYRWATANHVDVVDSQGTTVWSDDTGLALHDIAIGRAVSSPWLAATLGQRPTTLIGTLAPARPPPGGVVSVPDGDPCPTSPVVDRPYLQVVAATHTEVAGLGIDGNGAVTMVLDISDDQGPLTLSGRQLDGAGRMGFRLGYDTPPHATLTLSDNGKRSAPGWPPHWGIVASVSAPGCWGYEITRDSGHTDQIVVEIAPDDFEALSAEARHEPHELQ